MSIASSSDHTRTPVDMSAVRPVTAKRLSDEVAEQMREFIVTQDLQPGTRLPSERALADMFGTSRPTVSQALRTLTLMGLVETRRGSGAYVLRQPDKSITASVDLMLELGPESLDHLVNLRLWLETTAVEKAVNTEVADGVSRARKALERLRESVGETSTWIAADTLFHATIVGLAGNPYLTSIYESVHTALIGYEYQYWVERDVVPAWLQPSEAESQMDIHAPIVDALEKRDVAAAVAAVARHNHVMREHLDARDEL